VCFNLHTSKKIHMPVHAEAECRIGQPLPYGRITYTGSKGRASALSAAKRHPQRRGYYSTKGGVVNS